MTSTPRRSPPLIIDSHQHVGTLVDALAYDGTDPSAGPDFETDIRRRLDVMDSLGIDKAVLQPSHGYLRTDGLAATMRINDQMRHYLDCPGDRFCVFGTTEPMFGRAAVGEVERIAEIGLRGVAWHHRFQGCFIDSRWMWPILERMSDFDLVPLLHVNAESSMEAPWRLQRLAIDFPHLTFLAMDGLWSYERARHAQAIAGLTPNIIWDMGGPVCYISPSNGSGRTDRTASASAPATSTEQTVPSPSPPSSRSWSLRRSPTWTAAKFSEET
jgi:uncharacterized protein